MGFYPFSGFSSDPVTIQWTAQPNFSGARRGTTVNLGDQRLDVIQAANAYHPEIRFLQMLYWNFFGRWPAQSEIEFHLRSRQPRNQLALNFLNSEEFALGGLYVAGLYTGLLNRDPEFRGWTWQRQALAARSAGPEQVAANFLSSHEYFLTYGIPGDERYITLLYRNVLLREPAAHEVEFHVRHLKAGVARSAKAADFLRSAEFRRKNGPRLTASLLYFTLLNRDGSADERAAVVRAITGSGR
jgi:hypothetical protein